MGDLVGLVRELHSNNRHHLLLTYLHNPLPFFFVLSQKNRHFSARRN